MRRFVWVVWLLVWAGSALAGGGGSGTVGGRAEGRLEGRAEWMGIYLRSAKIGYSRSVTREVEHGGAKARRTETEMVINAALLGAGLSIVVRTTSLSDLSGRPLSLEYWMESAGRTMNVLARYYPDRVEATMLTSGGEDRKTLPIPAGAVLSGDPLESLSAGHLPPAGTSRRVLVFSPDSMELLEVGILVEGPARVDIRGREVDAVRVAVDDPRAASSVYFSSKGDLLKMTGPMGMEMYPESEEEAKRFPAGGVSVDLAGASRIVPVGRIDEEARELRLRVTGVAMDRVPSDRSQVVERDGAGWTVTLRPLRSVNRETTIREAGRAMGDWVKPDTRVPSDDRRFVELAKEIVGGETRVIGAAERIHGYVHERMRVNAGIGVMRDAREILDSSEGVCRDHAILAGTLMRAAGIPTRFANGLIFMEGAFYYHAWVEVWDGGQWVGFDTTRAPKRLSVKYIKTSQGTVGQALQGFLLDGAKIEVLSTERED